MALSCFPDKNVPPSPEQVAERLGQAAPLWSGLADRLKAQTSPVESEWKHYGQSSGWTCLLKSKKRTIVYLFPQEGYITVCFVFGEKAVREAEGAGLPAQVLADIREAKSHVEGRSFHFEVRSEPDLAVASTLMGLKLGN